MNSRSQVIRPPLALTHVPTKRHAFGPRKTFQSREDVRQLHVILVEDIVDSGKTLSMILEKVKSKNPASVRVCVLIDKHERREIKIPLDYSGFRVEEGFIVQRSIPATTGAMSDSIRRGARSPPLFRRVERTLR